MDKKKQNKRAFNIFFLILYCIPIINYAQPEIRFFKQQHDFGKIANLDYPPAMFRFRNTGNEPLAILIVEHSDDLRVKYRRQFIEPDDTASIKVNPYYGQRGEFKEQLKVLTNAGPDPVILNVTGNVISVEECFPNQQNLNVREIYVINKNTSQPVPNATIDFTHNFSNEFEDKVGEKGKLIRELKIGQYQININEKGYEDYTKSFFLKKSVPVLFLKLTPIEDYENVYIDPEPVAESNPGPPKTPVSSAGETGNNILSVDEYAANNIVLLLDVSLSMRQDHKLDSLKSGIESLVDVLRSIDNVSIITYAGETDIIIESVTGDQKNRIKRKIEKLEPGGITNGVKGLTTAYEISRKKYIPKGNNQIIVATDGKFTGRTYKSGELKEMVQGYNQNGVVISIIGFGVDETAIELMKDMAKYGGGDYIHVSAGDHIRSVLIDEIKNRSRKQY